MRTSQFTWLVVLAGASVVFAFAIVVLSAVNDKTQQNLQAQQVAINNGVLGPQGQQISAAILQDMANASANDRDLRMLLKRYGYTVQAGASNSVPSSANTTTKGNNEVGNE